MRLKTPEKIRNFQRKLYLKAKAEPDFRFYLLYDKIYREDILLHAYRLARSKKGAPGGDGQTFEMIEARGRLGGREMWLSGIRDDLRAKTYRPLPVRRATVPKPGGGERPLGIPTIWAQGRDGWCRAPSSSWSSRSSRPISNPHSCAPSPMATDRNALRATLSRRSTSFSVAANWMSMHGRG
jgi:hypothetical protein